MISAEKPLMEMGDVISLPGADPRWFYRVTDVTIGDDGSITAFGLSQPYFDRDCTQPVPQPYTRQQRRARERAIR